MNFWNEYMQYVQDNPEGYWFKRKLYGWGWVPANWKGWLSLGIFIALYVFLIVSFTWLKDPSNGEVLWFLSKVLLWGIALIVLCFMKGETPRWQWGLPEKNRS